MANNPPVAGDDTVDALAYDKSSDFNVIRGSLVDFTGGDTDPDFDGLKVSAVNGAEGNVGVEIRTGRGFFRLDQNGDLSYTADRPGLIAFGAFATDGVSYTVADRVGNDPEKLTDTASITFKIMGVGTGTEGDNQLMVGPGGHTLSGLGGNDLLVGDGSADFRVHVLHVGHLGTGDLTL